MSLIVCLHSLLEIFNADLMILRFGFYAAEWNSLGGDTMFVLSGDEDRWLCQVEGKERQEEETEREEKGREREKTREKKQRGNKEKQTGV